MYDFDPLWRGGLPPLGCEATPKPANAFFQISAFVCFGTAAQSNGAMRRSDKPPRHRYRGVWISGGVCLWNTRTVQ
ncbi:hypothetical protein EAH78_01975 [Pseudomonas arsenicoxydans]|uniref:Uncharacterized protein n=1 Tax=Pseudomonas arsenicoxydans TaxID=702115 RepID=A0A502I9K2_9PSED|nr:hypothetical protein EAH78_01975 [Pseudomonas arsenicoxydans]